MLEKMNKNARRKDYMKAIPLLQQHGISCYASLIVGYPGETAATVQETIDLIEEAKPDYYRAQLWYADPLTPVWEQREALGIRGEAFNWSHATMDCETACDHVDRMLLTVRNSVWMPQNGFEQWSTFYLQRRGMSRESVRAFIVAFNDGVKEKVLFPERREASAGVIARIRATCQWDRRGGASAWPSLESAFPPDAYQAAETYFLSEVCAGSPRSSLEGIVVRAAPGTGDERSIDVGVVRGSSDDVLAAYGVLLARVGGCADPLVMVGNQPVRLNVRPNTSFDQCVRDAATRVARGAAHAQYATHFLTNGPRLRRHGLTPPVIDTGFSVNGRACALCPSLVLHLEGRHDNWALSFRYVEGRIPSADVESLAAHFAGLWADVSTRRASSIDDVRPGRIGKARAEMAADDFVFSGE
jgi:hypothetical protein